VPSKICKQALNAWTAGKYVNNILFLVPTEVAVRINHVSKPKQVTLALSLPLVESHINACILLDEKSFNFVEKRDIHEGHLIINKVLELS
jgi:hypothetical protein